MQIVLAFFRRSLFLRVAAVLVLMALIMGSAMQIVLQSTLMFRLFPNIMETKAKSIAELVYLVEVVPPNDRPTLLATFSNPSRRAVLRDDFPVGAQVNQTLGAAFQAGFSPVGAPNTFAETRFRKLNSRQLAREQATMPGDKVVGLSALEVSVALSDGNVLSVYFSPMAMMNSRNAWMAGFLIIVFISLCIAALRMIFRPLKELETAAGGIGTTSKFQKLEETGTEDLRRVARALNQSQTRVKALLAERSQMLAALAHDIRTGLTHLKLRLDKVDQAHADAFADDLATMEQLISDMLLYARAEQPSDTFQLIDLNAFVRDLVESLPYNVAFKGDNHSFWVAADRTSLKRAITNLTDNAHRYARDLKVSTEVQNGGLIISVEDRGPGIAVPDLDQIFDPFYRAETSRSRETGGSGLGLTISRALLSAHGATLSLENRDEGGLRAGIFFSKETKVS